jgi:hypothetical protein
MEWWYAFVSTSVMLTTLLGGSLYFHYNNSKFLKKTVIIDLIILGVFVIIEYFKNKGGFL